MLGVKARTFQLKPATQGVGIFTVVVIKYVVDTCILLVIKAAIQEHLRHQSTITSSIFQKLYPLLSEVLLSINVLLYHMQSVY